MLQATISRSAPSRRHACVEAFRMYVLRIHAGVDSAWNTFTRIFDTSHTLRASARARCLMYGRSRVPPRNPAKVGLGASRGCSGILEIRFGCGVRQLFAAKYIADTYYIYRDRVTCDVASQNLSVEYVRAKKKRRIPCFESIVSLNVKILRLYLRLRLARVKHQLRRQLQC